VALVAAVTLSACAGVGAASTNDTAPWTVDAATSSTARCQAAKPSAPSPQVDRATARSPYCYTVRPIIWTSRSAGGATAALLAWLFSVELGTSRSGSKAAAAAQEPGERVVDTSTSRCFDVAAAVAIAGAAGSSFGCRRGVIRHQRIAVTTGVGLLAASGALSKVARRHLGRFHRDSLTVHPDHELVDTGPYRRIRHPLYTATILMFVGLGAALGNWLSVGWAVLPAGALIHRVRVEEGMLVDALGAGYADYRRRTHRLIPRVW
jgi:protein-S-isoprenylcysteine O-methyltransferase Ste14